MAEKCIHCRKKAIFVQETGPVCKSHFLNYVQKKFTKTIRNHNLITKDDVIGVAFSGGKDSAVALYLLKQYCDKRHIKICAIHIQEGISKTDKKIMKTINDFCDKYDIELHNYSFYDEYNKTFDEIVKKLPDTIPCTMCAILRRNLINKKARELGITKLVTGHNMTDEAQTLLMNAFQNKPELVARSGMMPGVIRADKFIPRIKPLYFVKEEEIELFAKLKNMKIPKLRCPYAKQSLRFQVKDHLDKLSKKFPHIVSNIVRFNLKIKELVEDKYKGSKIIECTICKEPSNKEICNKCELLEKLK